jgi:hypothetical protein
MQIFLLIFIVSECPHPLYSIIKLQISKTWARGSVVG